MNSMNSMVSLDSIDNGADAKDSVTASASKPNRMKGMKIRDEFICPITYELMRDPVVASDGHTYERAAIEKWLKHHQISPRNGEPMASLTIANMNMKKLIQDIIDEVRSHQTKTILIRKKEYKADLIFYLCPLFVNFCMCLGWLGFLHQRY